MEIRSGQSRRALLFASVEDLRTLSPVDFGINSTYLHAHMPKINSSYVKICESSRQRLARVSLASRPKILNCYPRRSNSFLAHKLSHDRWYVFFVGVLPADWGWGRGNQFNHNRLHTPRARSQTDTQGSLRDRCRVLALNASR